MECITRATVHSLAILSLAVSLNACVTAEPESAALTGQSAGAVAYQQGIPGGTVTHVSTLVATVAAIDYQKRTVTLLDEQGNRKTLMVGPEATNFSQVKKGDVVKLAVVDELLIYVREIGGPGSDGTESMVAKAPAGEKPAVIAAAATEMTAVVKAVDLEKHTATLQLPDGRQQVVKVRQDVKLDKKQLGREVVFRMSQAMAISVETPE